MQNRFPDLIQCNTFKYCSRLNYSKICLLVIYSERFCHPKSQQVLSINAVDVKYMGLGKLRPKMSLLFSPQVSCGRNILPTYTSCGQKIVTLNFPIRNVYHHWRQNFSLTNISYHTMLVFQDNILKFISLIYLLF